MKDVIDVLTKIAAVLGVLSAIVGVVWAAFLFFERTHSSEDMVKKAEDMLIDYDPKKAFGEYILDSIEEVDTKAWRHDQMVKDTFYMKQLRGIDSLLRLNIRLTDKAKNAAENPH